VIGRAISKLGDEGPVELGKLEALFEALKAAQKAGTPFRRSLAGALVTLGRGKITVERAPPRRAAKTTLGGRTGLTTPGNGTAKSRAKRAKSR
jgi:tRNA(Ile)-lysidine synthase